MSTPYSDAARPLLASGLGSPLPLPPGRKSHPPKGWTGADAPYASAADVEAWIESNPDGNIGLRLAPGLVGLDVDAYDKANPDTPVTETPGYKTISAASAECGRLPRTVVCTSRGRGPSGIQLFRVPEGVDTADLGDLGPGVQLIRPEHRYMVAAPSIHPEGRIYEMFHTGTGESLDGPPKADGLPYLTMTWIERLRRPQAAPAAPVRAAQGVQYADLHSQMQERVRVYADSALQGFRADLATVAALPEGDTCALAVDDKGTLGEARSWEGHIGQDFTVRALRWDAAAWTGLAEGAFTTALRSASSARDWQELVAEKLQSKAAWAAEQGPIPEPAWIHEAPRATVADLAPDGTPSAGVVVAQPAKADILAADDVELRNLAEYTDGQAAERFAGTIRGRLIYIPRLGWHKYDDGLWRPMPDESVIEVARRHAKAELRHLVTLGDTEGLKHATPRLNRNKIAAVVSLRPPEVGLLVVIMVVRPGR